MLYSFYFYLDQDSEHMTKKKKLPDSFKWQGNNIEWARNYFKVKAESTEIERKVAELLAGYSPLSELSLSKFNNLIEDLNQIGSVGQYFIVNMSATWRAKKSREGKKHYNLSLDSRTHKQLKELAKKSSIPNASMKQVLTDLINQTYQTKVEAQKLKKGAAVPRDNFKATSADSFKDRLTAAEKRVCESNEKERSNDSN
ncbi:hypothetical protein ZX61_14440 [Vibrio sp. VPAP30]|nr:hypothetical protein ZX61_14440 [Vibrio sp. VPAP30]